MELKLMNEYSDRELLELIMASQAQIMNRLNEMAKHMKLEDPQNPWDPSEEVVGEGMWETVNGAKSLNEQLPGLIEQHQAAT
jgi:uncharacterized protein with von Willebrand factor type A (vWA) domain